MVERPKLEWDEVKNLKVITGWDVAFEPQRPFAIDMAGFAVNVDLFLSSPKAKFAYRVKRGYQESEFLGHLNIKLRDLEPRADMCTKVLVWHTRTKSVDLKMEENRKLLILPPSHKGIEV